MKLTLHISPAKLKELGLAEGVEKRIADLVSSEKGLKRRCNQLERDLAARDEEIEALRFRVAGGPA